MAWKDSKKVAAVAVVEVSLLLNTIDLIRRERESIRLNRLRLRDDTSGSQQFSRVNLSRQHG